MSVNTLKDRHTLAILATTILWGTFWIPLRVLDGLGNGSIYFTAAGVFLPVLMVLPWMIRHFRRIFSLNPGLWAIGITFAIATSFYAEGALRGNVARTI